MHLFVLVLVSLSTSFCMKLGQTKAPIFALEQERSEDGSPTLSIIFPDGFQDKIFLQKHDEAEENDCHYIGHLEKETSACVAMTGCPGQDALEFTISSSHLSYLGTMKWLQNGSVQLLESPLKVCHFFVF